MPCGIWRYHFVMIQIRKADIRKLRISAFSVIFSKKIYHSFAAQSYFTACWHIPMSNTLRVGFSYFQFISALSQRMVTRYEPPSVQVKRVRG